MDKEILMKKFKKAEKLAKQLDFENVTVDEVGWGGFRASNYKSTVDISADVKYGGSVYDVEIGWASAGRRGVDTRLTKHFIKMLENALKVKAALR